MKKISVDFFVGLFLLVSFCAFGYISTQLGEFSYFTRKHQYLLTADFTGISGLKPGATVEIAGVSIGMVHKITLGENNMARVELLIDDTVPIDADAIAAIRTMGIIGDKYIKIMPGGSDILLQDGEAIFETEAAVELEELISKYIFKSE